jgi:hypothetical protein
MRYLLVMSAGYTMMKDCSGAMSSASSERP